MVSHLLSRLVLLENGFRRFVRLLLYEPCLPSLPFVLLRAALRLVFIGALHEAGDAITLPFLGPLLQRNFLAVPFEVLFQALVPASTNSSYLIAFYLPCLELAPFEKQDLLS